MYADVVHVAHIAAFIEDFASQLVLEFIQLNKVCKPLFTTVFLDTQH